MVASSSSQNKQVGFIGLGNMGAFMAENLIKAGYELTVFDISKSGVDRLVAAGKTLLVC